MSQPENLLFVLYGAIGCNWQKPSLLQSCICLTLVLEEPPCKTCDVGAVTFEMAMKSFSLSKSGPSKTSGKVAFSE